MTTIHIISSITEIMDTIGKEEKTQKFIDLVVFFKKFIIHIYCVLFVSEYV